ncbi:SigE family RNA polymerase sigma factor [Glycomyces sp. NPDC046736]|uniref:SigE family RNA polymerase sigma factor n=1 Tax=Glycomyces sp. NPDC046736 TaxID=3155615 RepID=UPI0033F67A8C
MSGPTAPSGAPPTRQTEFEDFVRARSGALCAAAYLLTGDRGLAEDLVQDALARTWRSWKRLHRTANAEAYTRRTMYHLHVSRWRRRKVAEITSEELPERADESGDESETALRVAVHAALLSLPANQRAAIVLRYFEDHTEASAAAILDCPVTTLRSRVQRGLRRLRRSFPDLVLGFAEAPTAAWEREFEHARGESNE